MSELLTEQLNPSRQTKTFRLHPAILEKIEQLSIRWGISMSKTVEELTLRYEREEDEKGRKRK